MRATVMYGAGDVRVENVPDATLEEPTDALLVVTRSCICGSDLWPYKSMEPTEEGRHASEPEHIERARRAREREGTRSSLHEEENGESRNADRQPAHDGRNERRTKLRHFE